jgi:hypothetical protein
MWLDATHTYNLIRLDAQQSVVPWRVNVRAHVDLDAHVQGRPDSYVVGRLLADSIHRYEATEWDLDPWDIADGDSEGLEAAFGALLDENGDFRSEDFEALGDPIVYLYRFALHDDFANWRFAILDSFCRQFGNDALILAQHHTIPFSIKEFEQLGFRLLSKTKFLPGCVPIIDRQTEFLVRDNSLKSPFTIGMYPESALPAKFEQEQWLDSRGPW